MKHASAHLKRAQELITRTQEASSFGYEEPRMYEIEYPLHKESVQDRFFEKKVNDHIM